MKIDFRSSLQKSEQPSCILVSNWKQFLQRFQSASILMLLYFTESRVRISSSPVRFSSLILEGIAPISNERATTGYLFNNDSMRFVKKMTKVDISVRITFNKLITQRMNKNISLDNSTIQTFRIVHWHPRSIFSLIVLNILC